MEHINTHLHPIHLMYDLHNIWEHILEHNPYSHIVILTDSNTSTHCLPAFKAACPSSLTFEHLEIPAGEAHKNLKTANQLWQALLTKSIDRSALLINLGGGVVSDLGGWVAANYKRGIKVINLPTTLLAMVDASAGGKTAINYMDLKNMLGLFSAPQAVYICPNFLNSLAQDQLLSGFAEMLKHALIADKEYWLQLVKINTINVESISPHLFKSVSIKATIVDTDPYEQHERKLLNFGHTIGHVIEHWALTQNANLLHGEAVALGIWIESYLSVQKAGLSFAESDEIRTYIRKHYKKFLLPTYNSQTLESLLLQDKKTKGKKLFFSLLRSIGKADINYICDTKEVEKALSYYQMTY